MIINLHGRRRLLPACILGALACAPALFAETEPLAAVDSRPTSSSPVSSQGRIPNFHSLGEIAQRTNIYRCGNPVGPIAEKLNGAEPADVDRHQAEQQMRRLYDMGVRTVVSLQQQEPLKGTKPNPEYSAVALEKAAAEKVGLTYIAYPMSNHGKNSLQDMSDEAVFNLVDAISRTVVQRSAAGGVVFHCRSGKDRTGLVAAYLRVKYQHWSVDDAILEMRQRGHVWQKFSKPGHSYSWHEEHLRAAAKRLPPPP